MLGALGTITGPAEVAALNKTFEGRVVAVIRVGRAVVVTENSTGFAKILIAAVARKAAAKPQSAAKAVL